MAFVEYADKCFESGIFFSEDFNTIYAKEFKKFLYEKIKELKAIRVQTTSINDQRLNRWHEFLGFAFEGTRPKFLDGKDYNMWGIVWE